MEEELDSRNASIKRPHDADQDESFDVIDPSRSKRQRASPEVAEEASPPKHGAKKQKSGAVRNVNWNAGTNSTIRTTLKGKKRAKRLAARKDSQVLKRPMAGQ